MARWPRTRDRRRSTALPSTRNARGWSALGISRRLAAGRDAKRSCSACATIVQRSMGGITNALNNKCSAKASRTTSETSTSRRMGRTS